MDTKYYLLRGKDFLTDSPYNDFRLKKPISELSDLDKLILAGPYLRPNACQCSYCREKLQKIFGTYKSKKF